MGFRFWNNSVGFNAPLCFEPFDCAHALSMSKVAMAGISNGVYWNIIILGNTLAYSFLPISLAKILRWGL